MFHQVSDEHKSFYPAMPIAVFKAFCSFLKKHYEVLHFSELTAHYNNSSRPAAVITFDDAHYDIMENAWPILTELGLKFTVNVDTEILETGKPQDFVRVFDILNACAPKSYQNSKYMNAPIAIEGNNPINIETEFVRIMSGLDAAQKRNFVAQMATDLGMKPESYSRMLSANDVSYLSSKGVVFGSHSHTHPILTNIATEEVIFELKHSKKILEELTQKTIDIIAYPNGIWNEALEQIAKEIGFKYFLLTEDKINKFSDLLSKCNRFMRINQYHHSIEEALAHTYGLTKFLRKLLGR